ncbi:hypothetical protein COV16_02505 [Candidatus Woesearchaeota archaeon CG10_big_fil_rev_8_21_14_0_10_34_8]|nr:MAG: hypothetical protein COV16_02505 [Candidatus Woesearchaeota archaeon CG10_big_fil_rev_8_21_14_0_10_34_8]
MKKAQASIEFLFVIGFAMLLIIPSLALFGRFVQETTYTATASQVNKIGNQMLTTAIETYHGTNGSVIIIELDFPEGITEMKIEENALIFATDVSGEESEMVYYSEIPVNGNFEESDWTKGRKKFKFSAIDSGTVVNIGRYIKGEEEEMS